MCKAMCKDLEMLKNKVQNLEIKLAVYALEDRIDMLEEMLLEMHDTEDETEEEQEEEDESEDESEQEEKQCSECGCT